MNTSIFLGFKRYTKLHWVKIYFATPTFDRITKDEKANLVAKLSAIGGTLGLLTGFSIISGVEMFYFAAKILVRLVRIMKKMKNQKKIDSRQTVITVTNGKNEGAIGLKADLQPDS